MDKFDEIRKLARGNANIFFLGHLCERMTNSKDYIVENLSINFHRHKNSKEYNKMESRLETSCNSMESKESIQESLWDRCCRIGKVLVTVPVILGAFGVASFFPDYSLDPKVITNRLTPVLLIHGSDSNQQQWLVFRQFLSMYGIGHVFTVNLNKSPRKNDPNRDILDYARTVHNKLICMKKLYTKASLDMDQVILVGNSMGGLVGAAYCVSEFANIDQPLFKISALITISTPWKGSILGDVFCSSARFPEKYFRRHSEDRERLTRKMTDLSKKIPVYTYGSSLDILVTVESSRFPNPADELIDNRNDHWTTMVDDKLAEHVCKWISMHCLDLNDLSKEEAKRMSEITLDTIAMTHGIIEASEAAGNII